MKKIIASLASTVAITILSACSTTDVIVQPFGNDKSLAILEDSGVEPVTDDYIIQCYPQVVNIFNTNGTIADSLDSTFVSIESYNEYGESVQNGFGYIFSNAEEATKYFEYASDGIYEVILNNEYTVWFEREPSGNKQNIMENLDKFDNSTTYISMPAYTAHQGSCDTSYSIDNCKG